VALTVALLLITIGAVFMAFPVGLWFLTMDAVEEANQDYPETRVDLVWLSGGLFLLCILEIAGARLYGFGILMLNNLVN
jgi:uncharacterized membrane protein